MKFEYQYPLFQKQSTDGLENARNKLFSQGALCFKRYLNGKAQREAITYPFIHVAQCVLNAVSILYGVYLVAKSILTLQSPMETLVMICATLIQCATLLLNACNVLMSLCSLGSRALATAVNGYEFESYDRIESNLGLGPVHAEMVNVSRTNELFQMNSKQKEAQERENDNYKLVFTFV